jgi:uncharacterized membrane protein (DUF485 family)
MKQMKNPVCAIDDCIGIGVICVSFVLKKLYIMGVNVNNMKYKTTHSNPS